MHSHFSMNLDFKVVRKSGFLLFLVLALIFIFDLLVVFNFNTRLCFYVAPFLLHLVLSIFVKKKESWLTGAIFATLCSMLCFIIIFFLFLNKSAS